MNPRIPIATVFLAAATLLVGGTSTAQKGPIDQSIQPRPVEQQYGRGKRGGSYGQRGRPVQIRSHPLPRRHWVPGHYEWVTQQVWVPGWNERVWIEPEYDWRYDYCGNQYRVLIRAGYWRDVHHPGHYESRRVRVWRAGYWRHGGYGGRYR